MSCPIRTLNLSKTFRGVSALANLSFEVPENGIYGLIGPNGAGKSTSISILMNVIRPGSGRAEVLGIDSAKLSPRELASIGYISEDQKLPGWTTVGYLLSYLKPFYPTWDDSLAAEMIRDFKLPLSRRLSQLSRGMRMKTALVSALAYRPRLLIMDEPFAGLDPLVRDELIGGVLTAAEHATMLISSHDLSEIESFISHVGYLDQGRLRFSEEMGTLANRFREIEIITHDQGKLPQNLPGTWMNVERSDNWVRWVDTQFDRERSMTEIIRLFGDTRHVEAKPMPLRAIFVTLAKASQSEA
jgi:ABC-2 type transport system ATP-binding protein